MPRPNHDISNLVLGAVRDYADEHGLADEQAHEELLTMGLQAVGMLPESHLSDAAKQRREGSVQSDG